MFYDNENNPLTGFEQSLNPGQILVFQIQGDCKARKFLRSEAIENVTIEGRFLGVGLFVNLVTTGLDVGAFEGIRKTFEIRLTVAANAVFSVKNAVFQIKS